MKNFTQVLFIAWLTFSSVASAGLFGGRRRAVRSCNGGSCGPARVVNSCRNGQCGPQFTGGFVNPPTQFLSGVGAAGFGNCPNGRCGARPSTVVGGGHISSPGRFPSLTPNPIGTGTTTTTAIPSIPNPPAVPGPVTNLTDEEKKKLGSIQKMNFDQFESDKGVPLNDGMWFNPFDQTIVDGSTKKILASNARLNINTKSFGVSAGTPDPNALPTKEWQLRPSTDGKSWEQWNSRFNVAFPMRVALDDMDAYIFVFDENNQLQPVKVRAKKGDFLVVSPYSPNGFAIAKPNVAAELTAKYNDWLANENSDPNLKARLDSVIARHPVNGSNVTRRDIVNLAVGRHGTSTSTHSAPPPPPVPGTTTPFANKPVAVSFDKRKETFNSASALDLAGIASFIDEDKDEIKLPLQCATADGKSKQMTLGLRHVLNDEIRGFIYPTELDESAWKLEDILDDRFKFSVNMQDMVLDQPPVNFSIDKGAEKKLNRLNATVRQQKGTVQIKFSEEVSDTESVEWYCWSTSAGALQGPTGTPKASTTEETWNAPGDPKARFANALKTRLIPSLPKEQREQGFQHFTVSDRNEVLFHGKPISDWGEGQLVGAFLELCSDVQNARLDEKDAKIKAELSKLLDEVQEKLIVPK